MRPALSAIRVYEAVLSVAELLWVSLGIVPALPPPRDAHSANGPTGHTTGSGAIVGTLRSFFAPTR
jgi:hypothetical protein